MIKLKEITHVELTKLRQKQLFEQSNICPILKQQIDFDSSIMDHKHKTKAEKLGEDGKGLLRGVIHRQANIMEGKIVRLYKRYGLHKFDISLPELLRNIADYIENPPMKPEWIHPNERPKTKRLGKRDFNRICKYYFQMFPRKKGLPKYPKSGKLTKPFERYLEMANKLYEKDRKKPKLIRKRRCLI